SAVREFPRCPTKCTVPILALTPMPKTSAGKQRWMRVPRPIVVIVDDNHTVTKALAKLVERAGFDTMPFHRGEEALSYCTGAVADGNAPAVAVIDIPLPDINGLILAQKLRERFGAQTPIVVVSGDTSMETIKSLSHVGATYFFSKPINPAALVE